MPNTSFITISQKITDETEKKRLLDCVKKILPKDCGAIIRTSAMSKTNKQLQEDIQEVVDIWNTITEKYNKIKDNKPHLIYKSANIVEKMLIDLADKKIEKSENRKIWLNCGGFITIDKTEALTAIDVNTGKFTGKNDLEDTIYKVNKEATIEIAKQLRLRDIGGIIIIDYIDMKNQKNKDQIEELLKQQLKNDRAKTQVEGFTKLNLMELTRKHICSNEE